MWSCQFFKKTYQEENRNPMYLAQAYLKFKKTDNNRQQNYNSNYKNNVISQLYEFTGK